MRSSNLPLRHRHHAQSGDDTHEYPRQKLDAAAAAVKKVTAVKGTFDQQLAEAPVAEGTCSG